MLLLLLAGCASSPRIAPPSRGDASWRMPPPPGTTRYHLALGAVSMGATLVKPVTPRYPASQLAACSPSQEVDAQLVVDRTGRVSDVRGIVIDEAPPPWQQFFAAVRAAALQWRFTPLQIEHWAADANGDTHQVDSETSPFRQVYVFRFECHAGQPSVAMEPSGAAYP
ncbi:hypothetical protein GCM10008098_26890 [Rhodanobacter panaciterrae]|uniref:Lipoprotein n=1 Tax=Rhodanobacter panaciterrae TaxID=490572 RepID=A0ABQ3A4H2_9GAMM|nr:hypothetical protein [Rhodanobacter panaciterrae]GGY32110.1 hypothetical protein GCM10008098_26890 [Rhodanobacter panaciterrae]